MTKNILNHQNLSCTGCGNSFDCFNSVNETLLIQSFDGVQAESALHTSFIRSALSLFTHSIKQMMFASVRTLLIENYWLTVNAYVFVYASLYPTVMFRTLTLKAGSPWPWHVCVHWKDVLVDCVQQNYVIVSLSVVLNSFILSLNITQYTYTLHTNTVASLNSGSNQCIRSSRSETLSADHLYVSHSEVKYLKRKEIHDSQWKVKKKPRDQHNWFMMWYWFCVGVIILVVYLTASRNIRNDLGNIFNFPRRNLVNEQPAERK